MKNILWSLPLLFLNTNAYAWNFTCQTTTTQQGDRIIDVRETCNTNIIEKSKATGKARKLILNFSVHNRKIDPYSVCTNYSKNSLNGRFCLRTANKMFNDLCREDSVKNKPFCDVKDKVHPLM